ncbi:MAG: bifunctional 4-hydroxy-2-oxoglutarate aldolase/2-dehydro-3-deoxy-phosphogluconate aldolase [Acidobacteriota bacterium]|nr:bifunctional 4-hydroxy-2-oxoglutarate aldolase/2-dehydro-3-deoxy-phosphogluconate aldolase [Acidobacteriota bacterium]
MTTTVAIRTQVSASLRRSPIVAVVRTAQQQEAARQARLLLASGIEMIEITFSVPEAPALVRQLLAGRGEPGPPWIGMGTVSTAARARAAVDAGAEFFVTPNTSAPVAHECRQAGIFLIMGALTPTEIVTAHELGADLVKVYPLPTVGGPAYLSVVRQPLGDIPMLAAGGFGPDEIPAYARAGASAFGIAVPLLVGTDAAAAGEEEARRRIARALALARGHGESEADR